MPKIRLIVGLGNPGSKYEGTRHNAGAFFVRKLARLHSVALSADRNAHGESGRGFIGDKELRFLIPHTFMNESGVCLQKVSSFYKIPPEEIVVVYDEINLDVGEAKISARGGSGGHNGLSDIIDRLNPTFTRVRIGIGRKAPKEIDLADYVLGKFSEEDETLIGASMERSDCCCRIHDSHEFVSSIEVDKLPLFRS